MNINNRTLPGTLLTAVVSSTATPTIEAIAAVAAKKIIVWGLLLNAPTVSLTLKSAATALTGALGMVAGQSLSMPIPQGGPYGAYPYFETAAGEALNITTSAGVQVSGIIYYSTE